VLPSNSYNIVNEDGSLPSADSAPIQVDVELPSPVETIEVPVNVEQTTPALPDLIRDTQTLDVATNSSEVLTGSGEVVTTDSQVVTTDSQVVTTDSDVATGSGEVVTTDSGDVATDSTQQAPAEAVVVNVDEDNFEPEKSIAATDIDEVVCCPVGANLCD